MDKPVILVEIHDGGACAEIYYAYDATAGRHVDWVWDDFTEDESKLVMERYMVLGDYQLIRFERDDKVIVIPGGKY